MLLALANGGVKITNWHSSNRYLCRAYWARDKGDLRNRHFHPLFLAQRSWGTEMAWAWPTVTLGHGTGHLGPCPGAPLVSLGCTFMASTDVLSPESLVAEQESYPSVEVVIKSSLEPWGGSSKGYCSAGWGRGLRPILTALGS